MARRRKIPGLREPLGWQSDGHWLEVYICPDSNCDCGVSVIINCPFDGNPEALCSRPDYRKDRLDADWYQPVLGNCWVRVSQEHLVSMWQDDEVQVTGPIQLSWREIWPRHDGDTKLSLEIRCAQPSA